MNQVELIKKQLSNKQPLKIEELSNENTALIVIDMVNGFAKEGALYSNRVEDIITSVVGTTQLFNSFTKLFIADTHDDNSLEFDAYPPHCIDYEAEVIDELKALYDEKSIVIPKNSTNGFLSPSFQKWFENNNKQYTQYVLIGDCTDICVLQLALSLKAYYNEHNTKSRIVVPINAVETYHLDINNHFGDLMNIFALYNMELNGVEIVKEII